MARAESGARKSERQQESKADWQKSLLSTTAVPPPPMASLLNRTNYDMATHPAETADWVNVLFSQVCTLHRHI